MNVIDLIIRLLTSFIPQFSKIRGRGDCEGISLAYVLFNSIVATQHFTLGLQYFVLGDLDESPTRHVTNAGEWLNLVQFTGVWLGQLALFIQVLALPPARSGQKYRIVSTLVAFMAITVGPTMVKLFIAPAERWWITAIFLGSLIFLRGPIVQLIGVCALFVQARVTKVRGSPGALSIPGLFVQSAVFFLVGISFIFRLKLPAENWEPIPGDPPERNTPLAVFIGGLRNWYWSVGWAMINNIIFTFAQGVLGWIAWRRRSSGIDGELEPLLS